MILCLTVLIYIVNVLGVIEIDRFTVRLNDNEDDELIRLAKRLKIDLRKLGGKKNTLMSAVKLANKRLDEVEAKAQMFTDEEKLFVAEVWGLSHLQKKP